MNPRCREQQWGRYRSGTGNWLPVCSRIRELQEILSVGNNHNAIVVEIEDVQTTPSCPVPISLAYRGPPQSARRTPCAKDPGSSSGGPTARPACFAAGTGL